MILRVAAIDLESYLNFDPARRSDLDQWHALAQRAAPDLSRYFHQGTPSGEPGMRMNMIGYGMFRYTGKSGKDTAWPVVGLALQKNYISVYVSITRAGVPLVPLYSGGLKALRVGRNNFSFERFADLDIATLSALLEECGLIFSSDPENPVQYKESR